MAAPPPAGPARLTSSSVLGNGLRLLLAPQAGTALVALRGRIDAGSLHDGGTPGLAALAAEVLSRPAPGEDPRSPGLAWTLHDDPAAAVNLRFLEFAASGLPDDLPPVLETLGRRLAAAAFFSEGDWPALVRAAGERAWERAASPETALWQGALARLHPSGSPLSSPPWGREESFGRLTPQALRGFLTHHVLPSRTTLVVAGAVEPPAARSRIEGTLGRLARGTGPRREPSPAPPQGVRAWREVESLEPGKAQNEIRAVWPGDRSRPWDRTATDALLYLLGETGYAGRLGRALVEPGLVYSVYATLEEEGAPGFLMVRTAAAKRDTPEVLRRIRSILEDMARGRITREELQEARTYLGGKAARSREGAVATAAAVLDGASRPAPVTLTLDQLNDTARRLFRSGAPLALLAGPGTGP
jgi:zinc protease